MSKMSGVHPDRVRPLNQNPVTQGVVVYWMRRDQRVADNWALLYAKEQALERKVPLRVVVVMRPDLDQHKVSARTLDFMLVGLEQVADDLLKLRIGFDFLIGDPVEKLPEYLKQRSAGLLVSDMMPLTTYLKWNQLLQRKLKVAWKEVDAHNLVPVWKASDKQEFGAYTIRPKIHRQLGEYAKGFPKLKPYPYQESEIEPIHWKRIRRRLSAVAMKHDTSSLDSGEAAAKKQLDDFIQNRLDTYDQRRNDPNLDGQSGLSPYLHFGQLSAQRIYQTVMEAEVSETAKESFVEELLVRRELADNYCFYNHKYDQFDGFPDWAQKTLNRHKQDKREFVYALEDFEAGRTHDPLWNAAQMQMAKTGKMHGYMRMYWAKKILEWTESPEKAQEIAIYLNDFYSLDGRDPNGYAGIAWSIGGVHDRAWAERSVLGKVRYMNYNGAKRKFDVHAYISRWTEKD